MENLKLAEAIAWLSEAEELLDQAHANLKDLGLDRVWIKQRNQIDVGDIRKNVEAIIPELMEAAKEVAG
jgi:hypothetical protein